MAPVGKEEPDKRIQITDSVLIPDKSEKSLFSAWRITFFGALALLVILPLFFAEPYRDILLFLADGILVTFEVTILSMFFALIVGLLIGFGRISRNPFIVQTTTVYVEVIRGIPLLVQLFYIYYALGTVIQLQPIVAAVMAISICYGAYIGEIFRGGILSVPRGQMEAALALGLKRTQALRKVILPQTIRIVLPPIGNEFIAMLKDSSLVSILAVADLLRRGREFSSKTFYFFETFTLVALVYLILTLFFSRVVGIAEERLNRRGK